MTSLGAEVHAPQEGDIGVTIGPQPAPHGLLLSGRDTQVRHVKGGKEAGVDLIRRISGGKECLLALKVYKDRAHRSFKSDGMYREGRGSRDRRSSRAKAKRSNYGDRALAEEWARHEMDVLARLYSAGANVPYPVAHVNTRLVMQYLGSMTDPAPRLSEVALSDRQLRRATSQVVETMRALASLGWVHGDLSPYNVLWFDEAAWVIDFPQTTDLFLNPSGLMLLERDVDRVASWVGRSGGHLDPVELMDTLCKDANIR